MFLKETDLVDGRCPNHPNMEPIEIEEENYFFRLSAYQDRLVEYLSRPGVVVPEWRREEALAFVKQGLEDFSISREASRLPWGIPVPGDETQVMYVWFDALTNYISTLGWPSEADFRTFWEGGETLQLAGKDQVRFQSIMWQAMLMSAGIKATDSVFYHGFITSGGQKMSKSLGNVIDPYALVEEYGTDALRYFLARHVHPFEDSDVTVERFREAYNAHLANGLGNAAARVMTLAEKHLPGPVSVGDDLEEPPEYASALASYEMNTALEVVWAMVQGLDQLITEEAPFRVVKTEPERGREMIAPCVRSLFHIALLLQPFMPETSNALLGAIRENKKPENLFPRKE